MPSFIRYSSWLLILVLCESHAQGIETTERPDLSNPDLIYNTFLKDSLEKDFRSLYINAVVGTTGNYSYLNTFTFSDYHFARINGTYQFNNFSVDGKITALNNNDYLWRDPTHEYAVGDIYKTSLQASFFVPSLTESFSHDYQNDYLLTDFDFSQALRIRLSWNTETFQRVDSTIHRLVLDYDMVLSLDGIQTTGGWILAWRLGERDFIYGINARSMFRLSDTYVSKIMFGYGLCRQKIDGTDRWGNFKLELGVSFSRASIMYMVSRQFVQKFTNHELAVFLELDVFDRLWLKSPRERKFVKAF